MIDKRSIEAAQAAVNQSRERNNQIALYSVNEPGKRLVVRHLAPGDKGYLPPVREFVTIEFHNGYLTVAADYFNKLSKAKKNKLMKF